MELKVEIYVHTIIMADQNRNLIPKSKRDSLYLHLKNALNKHECKLLEIGGTENHVHLLHELNPSISTDELLKKVKLSSQFEMHLEGSNRFFWDEGYYVYTISKSDIESQAKEIKRQAIYHHKITLEEELAKIRTEMGMELSDDLTDLNENSFN